MSRTVRAKAKRSRPRRAGRAGARRYCCRKSSPKHPDNALTTLREQRHRPPLQPGPPGRRGGQADPERDPGPARRLRDSPRPHEHRPGARRHRGLDRRGQVHAHQHPGQRQGQRYRRAPPHHRHPGPRLPPRGPRVVRQGRSARQPAASERADSEQGSRQPRARLHENASLRAWRCSTPPTSTRSSRSTTRSLTACSTRPTCGSSSPPRPATPTHRPGDCSAWPRSAEHGWPSCSPGCRPSPARWSPSTSSGC